MSAPLVKGWCPGAYRPMMSGDGLVVRVRPRMGRLSCEQILILADLATRYGSGLIDLTSRGNLQIRGVAEDDHQPLLNRLLAAGLLDETPELEARRNILTPPFWQEGGLTQRLYNRILARLNDLPDLPAKIGLVLDTGDHAWLGGASGDFRFERGKDGGLILRADGAETGCIVTEDSAVSQLLALADWFVTTGGVRAGRMRRHLSGTSLPDVFTGTLPRRDSARPDPGPCASGYLLGAPFGAMDAKALAALIAQTGAAGFRVTPWRLFLLEDVSHVPASCFVDRPGDPVLAVHACPGAPFCDQAQVQTRPLAKALACSIPRGTSLHVSGCVKGCAFPRESDLTIVGANGKFDLVRQGAAWDEPTARGLSRDDVLKEFSR